MPKETRPADYPKLKNYKPTRFMLDTSHYDKRKADRAVRFIENLKHTKGKWDGKPFWLLPWQEQIIRDIFGIVDKTATGNFGQPTSRSERRMESPSLQQRWRSISSMPITSHLRKYMVQRQTGSRRPSFLM